MKRSRSDNESKKRFRPSGFVDPGTSGIYATCTRGREQQCAKELVQLFGEKLAQYYGDEASDDEADAGLSIEEQVQKELDGLKQPAKDPRMSVIALDCECLVFIKTRKPIDPETFVHRLCKESSEAGTKATRFTQRLSPVAYSATPTADELKKLAKRVLERHFHQPGQAPLKFAIQVTRRNFNALEKDAIIRSVAESVGRDHGHSVDLKHYDKLIMVECYKSNIGMSVVDEYVELERYNLQQIFDKRAEDGLSRVAEKPNTKTTKQKQKSKPKPTTDKPKSEPEPAAT